jgi:hypothetical protein
VGHVTTADGHPIDFGDLTVIPVGTRTGIESEIARVIPGSDSAYDRRPPFAYDPPESLLVLRGQDVNPYDASNRLSFALDRFLLILRLLFASTAESFFQVTGETQLVGWMNPILYHLRHSQQSQLRRTTRLSSSHSKAIVGLGTLIDQLGVDRTAMVVTSFDMALLKFTNSYLGEPWFEQIVDLTTALEAVLSGEDKEDIRLRLSNRAAALLSEPGDSATDIFKDIGHLYSLRSALVHGKQPEAEGRTKVHREALNRARCLFSGRKGGSRCRPLEGLGAPRNPGQDHSRERRGSALASEWTFSSRRCFS